MSNQTKIQLNEFIANLRKVGITSASHFYVYIKDFGTPYDLSLIEATQLPGYTIGSSEVRMYGEFVEMPHSPIYQNINLTFLIDASMNSKTLVEEWMAQVINPKTRAIGYYSEYTKDVEIYVTDKEGHTIYGVKLYEAWPKAIGEVSLSYSSADVLRLPVTLVYKWHEKIDVDKRGNPINKDQQQLGGIDPAVGQMGKPNSSNFKALIQQNEFITPESQGVLTGVTEQGTIPRGLSGEFVFDFAPSTLSRDLQSYGSSIAPVFSKASNVTVAAIDSAGMNPSFQNEMITGSKTIARDMQSYGSSITNLGGNLLNATTPMYNMSVSVGSLANTLSTINNTFNAYGLGTPFNSVISNLSTAAGNVQRLTSLVGLPSQLTTIGSNLSATGQIFSSSIQQVSQLDGYNPNVGTAMQNMQNAFVTNGSASQNAAAAISAYTGE